jgi:hypothetical protein
MSGRITALLSNVLTTCIVSAGMTRADQGPIERSALVGTYVLNRGEASDVIEVMADGTYVHSYKTTGGVTHTGQNRWYLEPLDGEERITFKGFVFALPGRGTGGRRSFWNVAIERVAGSIRFGIDEDLGLWYQKQPPDSPTR